MKVKDLKEHLQSVPDEFDVCLSNGLLVKSEEGKEEVYEIIFDSPIIGIAENPDDKEIRFIQRGELDPKKFGKYHLIGEL